MWECINCGETVEDNFEVCWNCQAEKGSVSPKGSFAPPKSQPLIEKPAPKLQQQRMKGLSNLSDDDIVGEPGASGISSPQRSAQSTNQISTLIKRYQDAYVVARVTNGFGRMIKAIGIIIGGLLAVGGFMIASNGGPGDPMSVLGIVGVVGGVIVGALFYVIGVLVSAQGQILKASLDSAVNSSPFLTNQHKAKIMSLPER